jgi:uncharacterized protein (TIGR02996 family)
MTGILSRPPRREDVEQALAAGDLPLALEGSEALLDSAPGDVDLVALRGAALLASGNAQAAVDVLAPVAQGADAPYSITSGLAICQAAAGDRAAALGSFRRALEQHPDEFSLRLVYAECLEQQGEADVALQQMFRAVHDAQNRGRWRNDATTPPALRGRVRRAMDRIDQGREDLFHRVLQPHVDAFGEAAMQRVAGALGVYLGSHAPVDQDPRQRPTFLWMPGLPSPAFFPRQEFGWYDDLEAATAGIRAELLDVLQERSGMTPFLDVADKVAEDNYLGGDPQGRAWDAFFFHRHGKAYPEHLAQCPTTAATLAGVPLTRIAAHAPEVLFSILAPDTHIKPHHGVTNTRVVTHLPLVIPEGDCKLVVGGEEHAWQEGRCVTFDDTFLHEAWNRTGQQRVVLILDTWNPYLTEPERVALRDLVEKIGEFNTGAGIN